MHHTDLRIGEEVSKFVSYNIPGFSLFQSCDRHEGDVPEFVMIVTRTFHNDAMLRPITDLEAVMIAPHSSYHLLVNLLSSK